MSPWLDLVLMLLFFCFAESRLVLQPGLVVELPEATFEEGVETGMIAVVVALERPEGRSEIVFFDDEPYAVEDELRMDALEVALADYRKGSADTALTLYADKSVSHGTVSRLVQMARGVGVERVNMGTSLNDE